MDSPLGQCPSWRPSWLLGGPYVLLLYVGWTQAERSEARGQGVVLWRFCRGLLASSLFLFFQLCFEAAQFILELENDIL
jgi:hypothetical protein